MAFALMGTTLATACAFKTDDAANGAVSGGGNAGDNGASGASGTPGSASGGGSDGGSSDGGAAEIYAGGGAGEAGDAAKGGSAHGGGEGGSSRESAVACPGNSRQKSWNAFDDFSATSNPCGVWSYGYSAVLGADPLISYTAIQTAGTARGWIDPSNVTAGAPSLGDNAADGVAVNMVLPGQSWAHPGPQGEYSTFRWTAPRSGTYQIEVQFFAGDRGETDGAVLRGSEVLFEQPTSSAPTYSKSLDLTAGETIDAAVGITGAETFAFGSTPVSFTITLD